MCSFFKVLSFENYTSKFRPHLRHKIFCSFSSSPSTHLLPPSSSYPWLPMVVSFMMINPRFNPRCRSKFHDDQSKIQDSREEIKKQQVKTSYSISIKRFFQKPNSTVLFYKRIFSNFLSYQGDYSLVINYHLSVIDYQWPVWFSKCFQMICNVPKCFSNSVIDYTILVIDYKWIWTLEFKSNCEESQLCIKYIL